MSENILEVKNLHVSFKTYAGISHAVRGVDFSLRKGETLAIVGESGCGKTVTSKAIMGLLPAQNTMIDKSNGAQILFQGDNLLDYTENQMTEIRGSKISMIFQDPMTSLNPTMRIGEQIAESILIHTQTSKEHAMKEAERMLELVKIPNAPKRMRQYPFEFSGGMRQRAMIAVALACKPEILIADEPTTALDVTIQAQIMELIQKYQPVCVVDMHEGVNFYGVNGSIGNSIVVGQTQSGFINALDILEMVNSQNGDYPDFALEGNAPVGSLNCTASRELGIDAFTIETSQKLPMEVRVSQQVLIVTNILQQYGMEFKLRPESGG